MDNNNEYKLYSKDVSDLLLIYQMIEGSLKLYIEYSCKLIKVLLPQNVAFNYTGKEHENSALGSLIKAFSKYSDNDVLIKDLAALQQKRNFVAHRALVDFMAKGESTNDMSTLKAKAWITFSQVQAELADLDKRIRGI
ncbi:MAG: hypothetical protein HRU05_06865 [Oceanospirillaceae bacterium]|nr:hypothetical protein [Oceanospirillaceae bacterium]